jgi:hypothetical protein
LGWGIASALDFFGHKKYPLDSLGQNGGEAVAFTKYIDEGIGNNLDFDRVMQYYFKCQNDYD